MIYGTGLRGKVDQGADGFTATRFVHVMFLPVIPLGSYRVTASNWNSFRGTRVATNWRSVSAAYMRWWGAVMVWPWLLSYHSKINGKPATATAAAPSADAAKAALKQAVEPHLTEYVHRVRVVGEPRETVIASLAARCGLAPEVLRPFFDGIDAQQREAEAAGQVTLETLVRTQSFVGEIAQRHRTHSEPLGPVVASVTRRAGVNSRQAAAFEAMLARQFAAAS